MQACRGRHLHCIEDSSEVYTLSHMVEHGNLHCLLLGQQHCDIRQVFTLDVFHNKADLCSLVLQQGVGYTPVEDGPPLKQGQDGAVTLVN